MAYLSADNISDFHESADVITFGFAEFNAFIGIEVTEEIEEVGVVGVEFEAGFDVGLGAGEVIEPLETDGEVVVQPAAGPEFGEEGFEEAGGLFEAVEGHEGTGLDDAKGFGMDFGPEGLAAFEEPGAGFLVSAVLRPISLDWASVYGPLWYVHAILVTAFFAYLPFSKFIHVLIGPIVAAFNTALEAEVA